MTDGPKFNVGDTVRYNGHQGRITQVFKASSFPKIVWRYYVSLRNGEWSVAEENIEKLVKKASDEAP